jgi:hypothetical protein
MTGKSPLMDHFSAMVLQSGETSDSGCKRLLRQITYHVRWISVVGVDDVLGSQLWIPSGIELIESKCFSDGGRLRWAIFENGSELVRIEESAFCLS